MKKIKIKMQEENQAFFKATSGSAGWDLPYVGEDKVLLPGIVYTLETGIAIEMPECLEAQVRSRSGLACRGLFVLNAPGTIDSDYRGQIKVIMFNLGEEPFDLKKGTRIAQLVFNNLPKLEFEFVDELTNTIRDEGGFGSTG